MTEEEIVLKAKQGDEKALDFIFEKYKSLVNSRARSFFLIGGDTDDLIQEGMIGLFKAIHDYDINKQASFKTFATICINRQIYKAITLTNSEKNSPLNNYISIEANPFDLEFNKTIDNDPINELLKKESYKSLISLMDTKLSKFEKRVLEYFLEGLSYKQMMEIEKKNYKSIDNTLKRVKMKLSADKPI
jgi:RNA polymerase sporulation-specific sigma factor